MATITRDEFQNLVRDFAARARETDMPELGDYAFNILRALGDSIGIDEAVAQLEELDERLHEGITRSYYPKYRFATEYGPTGWIEKQFSRDKFAFRYASGMTDGSDAYVEKWVDDGWYGYDSEKDLWKHPRNLFYWWRDELSKRVEQARKTLYQKPWIKSSDSQQLIGQFLAEELGVMAIQMRMDFGAKND